MNSSEPMETGQPDSGEQTGSSGKNTDGLIQEVRNCMSVVGATSSNLDLLYDQMDETKRRDMIKKLARRVDVLNRLLEGALAVWQDRLAANTEE